jgi:hypothetical protein
LGIRRAQALGGVGVSRHASEYRKASTKTHHVVAQIGTVEVQFGITVAVGCHVVYRQNRRTKLLKVALMKTQGGECFHAHAVGIAVWKLMLMVCKKPASWLRVVLNVDESFVLTFFNYSTDSGIQNCELSCLV